MKVKLIDTVKSFSSNVHIMVFTEGVLALALGIFMFLQILYYDYISVPPKDIGIIFSIGSIFSLLGFFAGPFIKKLGRKNLLCIGMLIVAVGIALHMTFPLFKVLVLGQIFISIGTALIQITELQLLYSYTTGQKECCAYSYKYSTNLIFGAIGAIIAGNISRIPYLHNLSYVRLFFVATVMLIIACGIRYFLLPKDLKIILEPGKKKRSLLHSIKFALKDSKTRRFSILLFINSIGIGGVGPYNNLILKIAFKLNNNVISYITFWLTILGMVGIMLMPTIIEKVGVEKYNLIIFIVTMVACLALSIPLTVDFFIVVLIIRCIFVIQICSSLDSLMMSNIECENRDLFAATKILVNGIASALGNYIGGWILNNLGYRMNYLYGGLLLTVGVAFFYLKVRKLMANRIVNKCCICRFKNKQIQYKRE